MEDSMPDLRATKVTNSHPRVLSQEGSLWLLKGERGGEHKEMKGGSEVVDLNGR